MSCIFALFCKGFFKSGFKKDKSLLFVSRYNADRQEINGATHASFSVDLFFFVFLFVFRQSVECKRDRSTHRHATVGSSFYSFSTPRSPYISGARSLYSELWPVVPVFSQKRLLCSLKASVVAFTRTRALPCALLKGKEEEIA